jgi:hypothetical protein
MATERVTTDQLRTGDVVHHYGMALRVDRDILHNPEADVYSTDAHIENWLELKRQARRDTAGHVANSLAAFITQQAVDHRWTIQGNSMATWYRESE